MWNATTAVSATDPRVTASALRAFAAATEPDFRVQRETVASRAAIVSEWLENKTVALLGRLSIYETATD